MEEEEGKEREGEGGRGREREGGREEGMDLAEERSKEQRRIAGKSSMFVVRCVQKHCSTMEETAFRLMARTYSCARSS